MATQRQIIRHVFSGGFSSDRGSVSEAPIDQFGRVEIPYLLRAENIFFELDGGPHKIGGAAKINSVAVESGATVTGVYDYWKQGVSGSPSQKRVIHAGTKVLKEDLDGTFDDLFTGLESGAIPNYNTFDDILILASSSTTDVPKSWDQSTAQNLAGTPPNFAFSETHKNRVWAAGDVTAPSRLYYSELLDPEDWVGAGSGFIDIDPGDGDEIRAIASHKNELWVFKGPYKGSIHRITGSSPSDFARTTFVRGIGAVYQNSIFRFKDDLGFMWSDGTIHSLKATASFGDFNEAALSRDINSYIRDRFNFAVLKKAWAAHFPRDGYVLIAVAVDGATDNNRILLMDYRFETIRWAIWTAFSATALASSIDQSASDNRVPLLGSTDGFVRKMNQTDRVIDASTAIEAYVQTPYFHYSNSVIMKTLSAVVLGIVPKGNYDISLRWFRDSNSSQAININQGGGDVLAPAAANQFTLNTSMLSGDDYIDRYVDLEEGGQFRTIKYELSNLEANEDMEIHALTITLEADAWSLEN